jgi:COP9 signalosome complex subunit 1
MYRI